MAKIFIAFLGVCHPVVTNNKNMFSVYFFLTFFENFNVIKTKVGNWLEISAIIVLYKFAVKFTPNFVGIKFGICYEVSHILYKNYGRMHF